MVCVSVVISHSIVCVSFRLRSRCMVLQPLQHSLRTANRHQPDTVLLLLLIPPRLSYLLKFGDIHKLYKASRTQTKMVSVKYQNSEESTSSRDELYAVAFAPCVPVYVLRRCILHSQTNQCVALELSNHVVNTMRV
jgi:hypothetical protein